MRFSLYLMVAGALALTSLANTANAQFLDDKANVKILKARAELLHQNKNNFQKDALKGNLDSTGLAAKVNCGSIDIANQVTSGGVGQDINVIITGDIINTNNHCINTPAP